MVMTTGTISDLDIRLCRGIGKYIEFEQRERIRPNCSQHIPSSTPANIKHHDRKHFSLKRGQKYARQVINNAELWVENDN